MQETAPSGDTAYPAINSKLVYLSFFGGEEKSSARTAGGFEVDFIALRAVFP
jgi:hypothetical protein